MIDTILDAALEYLDLGFSVIPIRPGPEKKPYIPWTEFQKRRASEEEVEGWWKKWPNANVAIITGEISGIFVIDGDGEIGSRWISEHLPRTSVYAKTGRSAGCHCFYRIPQGEKIQNKVGWKPKVDIRGEGGYVVAAPSIHHTGNVYSLIFREGLDGWRDLAEFSPTKTLGLGNLGVSLKEVKLPGDEFKSTAQGSRNASLASLLGKLINSGMQPEELWAFATNWNKDNKPPMGEKEMRATCASIWKKHAASSPLDAIKHEIQIGQGEIQEEPEEEQDEALEPDLIADQKTDFYPIECLQPGGLMQQIMDYTEHSSASHKPIFALSGAIAMVGHLCGQRLMTETGLRTNMYCVSLGYSGSGKNAPHSAIAHLLTASEARVSMGPTDTASGMALLKWLATDNHPVSLFTFDEIGMLFRSLKSPSSPMSELPRILTKIFSETDRHYTKSYADSKLNLTIPYHHLSLYASSTPGEFWGNLTEADTVSGFLARLMIFEAADDAALPRLSINIEIPKKLTEAINALWGLSPPINLARGDIARVPMPFVVPRSPGAQALFQPWWEKYFDLRNQAKEDEAKSAVYGRAAEHCAKLALIHAASFQGAAVATGQVGEDSIAWAMLVTDACISALLSGISRNIAKNQFHSQQQQILKFLRASGGACQTRILYRKLHLAPRIANELISSLLLSGEIRQEEKRGKVGRPSPWVVLQK